MKFDYDPHLSAVDIVKYEFLERSKNLPYLLTQSKTWGATIQEILESVEKLNWTHLRTYKRYWDKPNEDVYHSAEQIFMVGKSLVAVRLSVANRNLKIVETHAEINVFSDEEYKAHEIVLQFFDLFVPVLQQDGLDVRYWNWDGDYADSRTRRAQYPTFEDIQDNFPQEILPEVSRLAHMDPESITSKLVMLYGRPGTSKTTFIRSLVGSWNWCKFEYVTDPEAFLGYATYLMDVGERDSSGWRCIILEDCDSLITTTAKAQHGTSISRLLNTLDGFIGQSWNLIFVITANETVDSLNPALTRPGRCLSQIQFVPFSVKEANEWLKKKGSSKTVNSPTTLAELYAKLNQSEPIQTTKELTTTGMYL